MTMKDKILLPKVRGKQADRDSLIRVDQEVFDSITSLAHQTAMSKKDVASILLRDALRRVELVERKVNEMHLSCNDVEEDE